jgi:hypothetical protein
VIYMTHDGVHYMVESGDASDFHDNLPAMKADINNMRVIHTGEQKWFKRKDKWKIKECFGNTVVTIYGKVGVEEKEKEKLKLERTTVRYYPAFHTFDNDDNWIGVTVCTKGKWGPPYKLIVCDESKIHDFDFGQWNTDIDEVRPTDYDEQFIAHYIDTLYWEIPAAHEFVADGNNWTTYSGPRGVLAGGSRVEIITCTDTYASLLKVHDATFLTIGDNLSKVQVVDDWDVAYWDSFLLPSVEEAHRYYTEDAFYTIRGGSVYVHDPIPPLTACATAYDILGATSVDWSSMLDQYRSSNPNRSVVRCIDWNGQNGYTGNSVYIRTGFWGTFIAVDKNKGIYIYGKNEVNQGSTYVYDGVTTVSSFPWVLYLPAVTEVVTAYDHTTSKDYIQAFGKTIKLKDHSKNYSSAPERIFEVKPRMYKVGEDSYIGLVSIYRQDQLKWEYMMFSSGVEQYNDEDAMYEYISYKKHPITDVFYKDKQCYGNGEFSLVRTYFNEEYTIDS